MTELNRSRIMVYEQNDGMGMAVLLTAALAALALLLALPVAAQDEPAERIPAELSDDAVVADVPDDQVKKITIDGEGVAEVLDVDEVATPRANPRPSAGAEPRVEDRAGNRELDAAQRAQSPEAAITTSAEQSWDERIRADLLARLEDDPLVSTDSLTIESSQGEVTLSGAVASLSAKNRAGQLARMMRGVQHVENNLTVRPADIDDATIQQYVESSLRQEPAVARNDIAVVVESGQVTLRGVVNSWQEKNLAEDVAAQTRGVVAVTSQLEVGPSESAGANDEEIASRVKQRLRSDPWVPSDGVQVSVNDGQVTLSGTVRSLAQRERAFADAWVMGVQSVDASELAVAPLDGRRELAAIEDVEREDRAPREDTRATAEGETPRRATPSARTQMTNEEIQQAIMDVYGYSPRLGEFRPELTVDNGVVVLSGTASTVREKNLAEELAKNVRGVWSVENRIEVQGDRQFTDTELADKVREHLDNHPNLSRLDVAVTVMQGAAYLSGTVTSPSQQRQAAEVVSNIPGITTVYNEVGLSEAVGAKDDFELKQDIESALYWSPYVDVDDVDVTVTQGVATLSGTVERWAARLAAEEAAQQMGAIQVDNRLHVLEGPAELRAEAPRQVPINVEGDVIIRE